MAHCSRVFYGDVRRDVTTLIVDRTDDLDLTSTSTLLAAAQLVTRPVTRSGPTGRSRLSGWTWPGWTPASSPGVGISIRLQHHTADAGQQLRLRDPGRRIRRLLTRSGLNSVLTIEPSAPALLQRTLQPPTGPRR